MRQPLRGSTRYEDVEAIFALRPDVAEAADPDVVGESFGRVEEDFADLLDQSLQPRGRDSLDDLLAGAMPPRAAVAVDVGCGRGRDVVRLATRFKLYVHGVDPMPTNVDQAEQRVAAEGLQAQTELHLGRAEEIPLPDASVDVLWCKEAIAFTDLDAAMREFRRVMRPGAVGVIYQVLTGPTMSAAEANWLANQEMGFGQARTVRPRDVEEAVTTAGLAIRDRIDYAGEWGEAGEERDRSAGRRLLHVARLLRAPQLYIDRYGVANYRIMLADCLWHVYRMIGKLWGVAFLITHP